MFQGSVKSLQKNTEAGSARKGTVGFSAPSQLKADESENLIGSLSDTGTGFSAVMQQNPSESVNGISHAENNAVRDLTGGKVDLHESGASVQETSSSDSRLQSVGARSMAVGGQALVGDSRDRGHEIWHLAQQHMGMVQPTTTINNTPVNNDPKLEKDADDKGAVINSAKGSSTATSPVQQKKN